MLADYGSTGLTVETHPLALLRERLPAGVATSRDLDHLPHGGRVRVGGLVVARQRPGTAKGIVFLLLEDEFGTVNLIVPPEIYERRRLTVRTEPLMLATGRLEKLAAAGGVINVLVSDVDTIAAPDRLVAEIKDFSMLDEGVRRGLAAEQAAGARVAVGAGAAPGPSPAPAEAEDFRAVAPAVMSFGSGRRR
jgi:error-prone DNA polymerase